MWRANNNVMNPKGADSPARTFPCNVTFVRMFGVMSLPNYVNVYSFTIVTYFILN